LNAQQWKRMRPIIEAFFTVKNGFWKQGRLTDERSAVERHRQSQSEKGKAGAAAKSLKRQERDRAAAKTGLACDEAEVQPDASSLTHTHVPLDKSNGAGPDEILWAAGKAFIAPEVKGDPGKLIGKWCRDHGKEATAQAITRAQLERPAQRVPFIEGCFRQMKSEGGLRVPC
jgi:hypothetical protein